MDNIGMKILLVGIAISAAYVLRAVLTVSPAP